MEVPTTKAMIRIERAPKTVLKATKLSRMNSKNLCRVSIEGQNQA